MATTRLLSAMVATWNNVATTFTGLKLNVTDTASASGSLLMDLQVGGVSKASVNKFGTLITTDGVRINNNSGFVSLGSGNDVIFIRDAANTLALRNGTAAQKLSVYNTYTDASNYERGVFDWTGTANTLRIGTEAAGTGTVRNIQLVAGSNTVTMTPGASNLLTLNGGLTTGGTLTSGAGIVAGAAFRIGWAGVSQVYGGAVNGNIMLSNSGASDFGLLQFGGTTSSFPALKRSGTGIQVRLADDSGYSSLSASSVTASNGGFYSGYGTYLADISDGVSRLSNNGVTGFTRLILGTNDTSGVAIKKNGTSFSFVLGDDSAFASVAMKDITTSNTTFLHATSASLANGAAAQVATMTNGPTAGNPTKWIAINDNGVTRYIPAW